MEERLETIFIDLLKAGILDRNADTSSFPLMAEDWNEIYFMAVKQTVQGVVYDAVCRLPEDMLPPMDLLSSWICEVRNMETTYKKHFLTLNYLTTRFQAESDITPILEKGIGLASCYPHPNHRVSGDIDLYYGSGYKCDEAVSLIEKWGFHVNIGKNMESAFMLNDVVIENHGKLVLSHDLFHKARLTEWIDERMRHEDSLRQITVDNVPVTVLAPTLDILLLMTHSLKHLLNEGIGLRQLCDIGLYLKKNHDIIDGKEVESVLKMFGVYRWANLVFCFLVDVLGLDVGLLPYKYKKKSYNFKELLAETWKSGNFGHLDERNAKRPSGDMGGKMFTSRRIVRNILHFSRYAPGESLGWVSGLVSTRVRELF